MQTDAKQLPFFVYGTLMPGQPNFAVWGNDVTRLETAVLPNSLLYDLGQYPMLVETGAGKVTGFLVHIHANAYQSLLTRLDWLERYDSNHPDQSLYHRLPRMVMIQGNRDIMAWVYVGNAAYVAGLEPIAGGDWAAYLAAQPQGPPWWAALMDE